MFKQVFLVSLFSITSLVSPASAAEICGNGVDDDADSLTDEGCYPTLTTGQCESPLSCGDTGMVSPSTGSLRYSLPPDVAPNVPFGPGIGFRRFYASQYAPGGAGIAYRKPMGERWGHTYMSWLDKNTVPNPDQIVVHLPRGQDAMFKYTSTASGWDNYNTFQTGYHFQYLRQRTTLPNDYELKTLTGETFVYNSSGKLIEIWDTIPNKVLLTYDGAGMISTVTDASTKRRLLFNYTGSLLTSINFQINNGSWTTYHTTTYGYTSSNLTTVTIGGQLAQTNVYTSNYLTRIDDGGGKSLVEFVYDGAVAGKIVRVDTPRGVVGYEFASSRANCSGSDKTVLYFHKQNVTSCSIDTDCGTGYLCGGKTGAGSTGQCFRGARCLTVDSSAYAEDVVKAVSSFAGGVETCDGACLDALEYIWNATLDNTAIKSADPSTSYTVKQYNANGLPTRIQYGSADATGTTKEREEFISYDAAFPGRISSRRHLSDLPPPGYFCIPGSEAGCSVEFFSWNSNGTLAYTYKYGFALNSSGARVGQLLFTNLTHDPQGRLTQTQLDTGAHRIVYEYWSGTNPLFDGFLQNVKRYTSATTFLSQSSQDFDFWGNPIRIVDADGTISCQTFSAARGHLTQRREQMAGQTDCTANAADIVTNYERDSALRLTKLTRPDLSCMIYEYDTRGRLSKTKRRDDCNTLSSGDREEYTYSVEGLLTKVEAFDSASTVTKRQELTYFDSRRLEKLLNPVNVSKWTGFVYEDRGLLASVAAVDGANNLSKTDWTYNKDARITSEKRYSTSSLFDTWNLLFSWIGDQKQVTDGDSKITSSTRSDLGKVVHLSSPDLGGFPTLRVFDNNNLLTTVKESFGGAGVKTHTFTYDTAGRSLNSDYNGQCFNYATGGYTNVPDIVRAYDCVGTSGGCTSGAPACPGGTSCTNIAGRLAYVKVKLMCTTAAGPDTDYTLEQETWYGYDAAGRVTHEFIKDDSDPLTPRTAAHVFALTKNGALQQVTLPSTVVLGATFGSAGSNSDTDRITALWRTNTSTPIIDSVLYQPYGPVKQYNQKNSPGSGFLRTRITHNLAYRQTLNTVEKTNGTNTQSTVTLTEDAKGRVTTRDYFPSDPTIAGRYDSTYTYDLQDRVICEATTSGACPTSGTTLKNNHNSSPPFKAAGDWKEFKRPIPGSTGVTHTIGLSSSTTHQIGTVNQSDGTPAFGTTYIFYDGRGNRSSDFNEATLSHDDRTYTYDDRRNVTNVRGEYFTGGTWRFYNVASAFDAKNRRVFKSFYDETTLKTATWFFYYDSIDRLVEVRYTPDTSVATTYSLFQLSWLGNKLVAYWQTDYPSVTTSKRYVSTDEANRPVDMMSWPSSGAAARVWTINPDAWGNDKVLVGPTVFQPILFAGQYKDDETTAWLNDGTTRHRPGVVLNGYRTYDPWTGSYLQLDPLVGSSWSSYVYVDSDPVGKSDTKGLAINLKISGISFDLFWDTGEQGCWKSTNVEEVSSCLGGFHDFGFPNTTSPPRPPRCSKYNQPGCVDDNTKCTNCRNACDQAFEDNMCSCIAMGIDKYECLGHENDHRTMCLNDCLLSGCRLEFDYILPTCWPS